MPISRENAFVVRGTAFGRKPNAAGLQALSSEGDLVFVKKGYAARRILERALADRDGGWHCFYCGNPCANTIDHVVPRYRGGSDGIDNLVFACWWCNDEKNTQPGWSFALRKAGTPREEWRDSAGRPLPPLNLGLAGNSVGIPSEAPDHELWGDS